MPTPIVKGTVAEDVMREIRKKPSSKAEIGAKSLQAMFRKKEGHWEISEDARESFISQLSPLEDLNADDNIVGYRDEETDNYVLSKDWDDNYD